MLQSILIKKDEWYSQNRDETISKKLCEILKVTYAREKIYIVYIDHNEKGVYLIKRDQIPIIEKCNSEYVYILSYPDDKFKIFLHGGLKRKEFLSELRITHKKCGLIDYSSYQICEELKIDCMNEDKTGFHLPHHPIFPRNSFENLNIQILNNEDVLKNPKIQRYINERVNLMKQINKLDKNGVSHHVKNSHLYTDQCIQKETWDCCENCISHWALHLLCIQNGQMKKLDWILKQEIKIYAEYIQTYNIPIVYEAIKNGLYSYLEISELDDQDKEEFLNLEMDYRLYKKAPYEKLSHLLLKRLTLNGYVFILPEEDITIEMLMDQYKRNFMSDLTNLRNLNRKGKVLQLRFLTLPFVNPSYYEEKKQFLVPFRTRTNNSSEAPKESPKYTLQEALDKDILPPCVSHWLHTIEKEKRAAYSLRMASRVYLDLGFTKEEIFEKYKDYTKNDALGELKSHLKDDSRFSSDRMGRCCDKLIEKSEGQGNQKYECPFKDKEFISRKTNGRLTSNCIRDIEDNPLGACRFYMKDKYGIESFHKSPKTAYLNILKSLE